MLDKIKKYQKHPYVRSLQDIRAIGLVMFVIIVLLISWSGVKVIQSNYQLQKQISVLQQQVAIQQLQNNNLKLQNDYYNSNQYLELSARQNFGLASPGEKELIVPKDVALAHTVTPPAAITEAGIQPAKQNSLQRNLTAWKNFLTHNQNPN